MNPTTPIGVRISALRIERGLTQQVLGERVNLSAKMVSLIERGERGLTIPNVYAFAEALGVEPGRLLGNREHLAAEAPDRGVLGVRDAILPPGDLPGFDGPPDGVPVPVEQLERAVDDGWDLYWAGQFGLLARLLPSLLPAARASEREYGTPACRPLAQAYQLAADLMVHMGDDTAAFTAVSRAVRAAHRGDDPLQHATLAGTASWVLLHQGRLAEAEQIAAAAAEKIRPDGKAGMAHLNVWGALLLSAAAPAAVRGDQGAVAAYMADAGMAAIRFTGGDRHDYHASFGLSQMRMQRAYQMGVLDDPVQVLAAASGVVRADLLPISWGALHLDVARAYLRKRQAADAVKALLTAYGVSRTWAVHQGQWRDTALAAVRMARRKSDHRTDELAKAAGLRPRG